MAYSRIPWGWGWWVLALLVGLAGAALALRVVSGPSLPRASQIERMAATLYESTQGLPEVPPFIVPPEHVDSILSALVPATRAARPALCLPLGQLVLHVKDGGVINVTLYYTYDERAAFSVDRGGGGMYFRGGTDRGIEDAVRQAYATATTSSSHTNDKRQVGPAVERGVTP
jgi:hypothetical protein